MSFTFLGFTDVNGALRGKAHDAAAFEAVLERGQSPCTDLLLAVDPRDQPITTLEGIGIRSGAGDLMVVPLPRTRRELPWRPGAAICLGDLAWEDGSPCELSSRRVLQRAVGSLAETGLRAVAALEYEVRLSAAQDGRPLTSGQSYSLRDAEVTSEFAERLQEACATLGLGLSAVHTEAAPGLLELNTPALDALEAADAATVLRHAVREVARRCGLVASFLAKPVAGEEGSSGHVHVSVWSGDTNVMTGEDSKAPNAAMRHAVGGVLRHLPAMGLLLNPNVNSYKRLVPGFFAPVNATWGVDNRSAAVRAIAPAGGDARLEVRRPGADANPYLALAAVVASIAEGLRTQAEPPAPFVGDAYAAAQERHALLPCSLEAAVGAFLADGRAQELVGQAFSDYLVTTRRWELRAWQEAVSDWERERYGWVL